MKKAILAATVAALISGWTASASAVQVYSNDFNSDANNISGGSLATAPLGEKFLMLGGGTTATLSLSGLGSFTSGTVSFLLYGIKSVDGNGPFGGGADPFTVTGPGGLNFTTNIANFAGNTQAFGPAASNAPGTGATAINTLGYTTCCFSDGGFNDSIYSITLGFSSSSATSLSISFFDGSNQGLDDEFQGIDSLVVTTNADASAVPGPAVGAGLPGLVMAFGGLVAWTRRRKAALAA